MTDDEYCPHDSFPDTCGVCNPPKNPPADRVPGPAGLPAPWTVLRPSSRTRDKYLPEREATFEPYVEVFFRLSGARAFQGGWTMFSRCADAEPALLRDEPTLVARAEELMRLAGYEADDSGRP